MPSEAQLPDCRRLTPSQTAAACRLGNRLVSQDYGEYAAVMTVENLKGSPRVR